MPPLKTTMAAVAVAAVVAGTTTVEAETLAPATSPSANSGYCDASSCENSASGWMVFDFFRLKQTATITDFGYYSYLGTGTTAGDYVSTNWSIWSGSATGPSSALVGTTPTAGVMTIPEETDPDMALVTVSGLSVTLTAGTYWLGVQNVFETSNEYSTYATTGDDSSVYLGPDPAGQYTPAYTATRFKQVAFSIDGTYDTNALPPPPPPGVPEPSTWAMSLFGFAGLVWLAHRRVGRPRSTRVETA